MEVTPGHHDAEIRLTVEAMVDLVNALHDAEVGAIDVREILVRHGFTRAPTADEAEVDRLEGRLRELLADLRSLPDAGVDEAAAWINGALRAVPVEPWLIEHDGAPLHIHWTRSESSFDDQILGDIVMALAQELVDHGTARFGRCGADDCDHLFHDTTRNHSRRFCADPRCASRTHTATHRARRRGA